MNVFVKLRFVTKLLCLVGFSLIVLIGCQGNIRTGDVEIYGIANLKMPALPQTGPHAIQIFSEMHYQHSYRSQEKHRLLPPPISVPIKIKIDIAIQQANVILKRIEIKNIFLLSSILQK